MDQFQEQQLFKRTLFVERVHAAFILNTSLNEFGKLEENQICWLRDAYPASKIKTGTDQGASYYSITPKFNFET